MPLIVTMSCVGQSSKDTTISLPAKVVRALLVDARQKDVLQEEVTNLKQRIALKQQELSTAGKRDSTLIASLNSEIEIMKSQRQDFEGKLKQVEKDLKRARRKTKLVALAGIITTAAGIFFIK